LYSKGEVSYEPFTWVRDLKVEIRCFAENASLLSKNPRVEQYGSTVKSSLALVKQDRG